MHSSLLVDTTCLLFLVFIRQERGGRRRKPTQLQNFSALTPILSNRARYLWIILSSATKEGHGQRGGHRVGLTSFRPQPTSIQLVALQLQPCPCSLLPRGTNLYFKTCGNLKALGGKRAATANTQIRGGISSRVAACCSRKNRSFGCRGKC